MPESVTDRPTKAHEYVFLLAKSKRYYFDQEAVREPHARLWDESNGGSMAHVTNEALAHGSGWCHRGDYLLPNPNGRNIRTVWTITTKPYPEAHFATMPPDLAERCIKAGTSERGVCPECGAPWERVVERENMEVRPGPSRCSCARPTPSSMTASIPRSSGYR
ncbi:MAG: DNA methylase [Actinobacteria bacterium ADurb.Bin444]|nr:MAG: DNA methylase [Actinobacteria bacterium ADurb.Bin444]